MPRVSVVIPAFNAERYLRETLESVLAQTYRDFEVVVVDDGSSDGTAELVESFAQRVAQPPSAVRCIRQANAQMMTSGGPLPIEAPLDAKTLEEATDVFPDAIREAVGEVVEHMRELQRQAASRIVVPSGMPGGPGGKIQLG